MSVEDQPMPSNELYAIAVKERYANKAANYEEILKQERADEHSNRNRVHRKRFALEGRKQKKRCAKKATPTLSMTQGINSNNQKITRLPSESPPNVSNPTQEVDNHLPLTPDANLIAEELIQEIEKKWPEAELTKIATFLEGREEAVWLQLDSEEERNAIDIDY